MTNYCNNVQQTVWFGAREAWDRLLEVLPVLAEFIIVDSIGVIQQHIYRQC